MPDPYWYLNSAPMELDMSGMGNMDEFRGSSPLDLYYYLMQPRNEMKKTQSGPYTHYGPERYSSVPKENLAAAAQLMDMMLKKKGGEMDIERAKIAEDIIRGAGTGGGEMSFGGKTMEVKPSRKPDEFSQADTAQLYAGGYIPTGTRGIPPGVPGGHDSYGRTTLSAKDRMTAEFKLADFKAKRVELYGEYADRARTFQTMAEEGAEKPAELIEMENGIIAYDEAIDRLEKRLQGGGGGGGVPRFRVGEDGVIR